MFDYNNQLMEEKNIIYSKNSEIKCLNLKIGTLKLLI